MRKEKNTIAVSKLSGNTGQIDWLPKNPRQWTAEDVEKTRRSIVEDEDFLEDRPPLVVEHNGRFIVFAGNLRLAALKKTAIKSVPCVVYSPESDEDRETVKRRAMKDNGSFGSWDFDTLANEWDDLPLVDYGIPVWDTSRAASDLGLSTKGREGEDEDYDEFVDKFKQKLTTDDCYTPPAVYDAVLAFVESITSLKGKKVERPFVPGGDYEHYPYQPNSIVVDNPPFSLLSQICRFYCERKIPFFIFAPALTLFSAADCDLTYIISDSDIEYENGAKVRTGFITNLIPDLRIWCCPELRDAIIDAQPDEDKTKQGFVYPDNIVTSAILGKITKRSIELKIRKASCEYIKQSDSAEEQGRALYGGGFIMSDRAAAERAAAERAAAERAAATRLNLSPREKAIIAQLNERDAQLYPDTEKVPQN